MQHIYTEFVLNVDVSTGLYEELTGVRITLERAEVQGHETVGIVFQVDPGLQALLVTSQLRLGKAKDDLEALEAVVESALMEQSLAILIYDLADGDFRLLDQVGLQSNLIVFVDELRAFTVHLSQSGFHLARMLHLLHVLIGMRPGLLVYFDLVIIVIILRNWGLVLSIDQVLLGDFDIEAARPRLEVRLVGCGRGRPTVLEVLLLFPVRGALARGREHGVCQHAR